MYRRLIALSVLSLASLVAAGQERDLSNAEIKVTALGSGLYLLQGEGGNIAASVGADGSVLIDDEFAPLAEKITAALASTGATTKPVRFIFLTHYHFDHVGGNLPFANAGATIIAHENLRSTLLTDGFAGNGGSMHMARKAAEPGALPVVTFDRTLTVHLNGEDIRAEHFAGAHTSGDSIVFFNRAHAVHMGDIFVRYGFPFIDVENGGSVQGMISACEAVLARLPADAKVIPGHGELAGIEDLRTYVKVLKDTTSLVSQALKRGRTLEQMKKDDLLGAFSEKYTGKFVNTDAFLESLYYSLAKHARAPTSTVH